MECERGSVCVCVSGGGGSVCKRVSVRETWCSDRNRFVVALLSGALFR